MDQMLIDYLKSGRAWLLVGSGPSTAMGYPSWERLAEIAIKVATQEADSKDNKMLKRLLGVKDYPAVFEKLKNSLGNPRLLQVLRSELRGSSEGEVYELIARWPVRVYLTTNYDDEISNHLSRLGESYRTYSNSQDHLALMNTELDGAVVKLHGDLTTPAGLILTRTDYQYIQEHRNWEYWRVKLTSVFQMLPVIIIGHSLTDKNIRHVLEAAKNGAGIERPVCWIAPDVPLEVRKEYLFKYRIRVISYSNVSGDHKNLVRLIEHITDFVPPRLAVHMNHQIREISKAGPIASSAAPAFYVYNRLSVTQEVEEKRVEILLAVIESSIPKLKELPKFTISEALKCAGWPQQIQLSKELNEAISKLAVKKNVLERVDTDKFSLSDNAEEKVKQDRLSFEHLRERFKRSLQLRIKAKFPDVDDRDAAGISSDIEASLIGYFREGGLSLTTALFSENSKRSSAVPSSIIRFITEASTKYDDSLRRQVFCTISVDSFKEARSPERAYLGRIAQGFFAFHALGVFGEVAIERLSHAKETVWLVDSNVLIGVLALGSSSNSLFRDCFERLSGLGVRLFATERLLDEVHLHFHFASKLIENEGDNSPSVLAGASGDPPYSRSNAFLEGFVKWQASGKPRNWGNYLFDAFGSRSPTKTQIRENLRNLGVEIMSFDEWPGFQKLDFEERDKIAENVVKKITDWVKERDSDFLRDPYKKAQPEAEVLLIVKKERDGSYFILSEKGKSSPSYFVSDTSVLNIIVPKTIITWQPESFVKFIFSLAPIGGREDAERGFESLLLAIARNGVSLIDDEVISTVFGGVIDQECLNIAEQREQYRETLTSKYGEPIETVLNRVSLRYRSQACTQLAEERAQLEATVRKRIEKENIELKEKTRKLESRLEKVEQIERKQQARTSLAKRKKRKNLSKSKKNKKKR